MIVLFSGIKNVPIHISCNSPPALKLSGILPHPTGVGNPLCTEGK